MKPRIFTAGPTPVPQRVVARMNGPMVYHRSPEFRKVMLRVNEGLQYVFRTYDPVLTLTGSGTAAMEAALVNTLSAGETIIYTSFGKFSERWGAIATRYGLKAYPVESPWGMAPSAQAILQTIEQHPDARALCLTHSETSTGVMTDMQQTLEQVRTVFDGLVMVDGISSVGAVEFCFDEWEVDVAITASQKALMLPPGLAFIALSPRAWRAAEQATLPRFYFDLEPARRLWAKGQTPWTPATPLVLGADLALEMIRTEDIENVWARHRSLAEMLHHGLAALDLKVFGIPPSYTVTAVMLPTQHPDLIAKLKNDHGILVSEGQEQLSGTAFRIGHMGYVDHGDIHALLRAIGTITA